MSARRALIVTLVALSTAVLGACAGGPPAASPTNQPTGQPTDQPTASPTVAASTAAPTSSPTEGAAGSPTPCVDYYGEPCAGSGAATTPPAQGSTTVSAITYGQIGAYLAGATRMALYTFDNDSPGASSCTGSCAETWPPLTLAMGETPSAGPGIAGTLGVFQRADGSWQVTYDDAPLYYYSGDQQIYDTTGDGLSGVWHLARP